MSFNSRIKSNQNALTATAATGASGTVVAGNKLLVAPILPGTKIGAEVTVHIETASVTLTPSYQGSVDGTNWLDLYDINNPANVAMSASGTHVILLAGQPPFRYLRAIATVGGATATANDTVAIRYHFVENPFNNG